jgi:hypothetical protein|tara:strand:+ start:1444 stop:1674 length:231 start_codon:yes stop_codon:yes gene_type:complete
MPTLLNQTALELVKTIRDEVETLNGIFTHMGAIPSGVKKYEERDNLAYRQEMSEKRLMDALTILRIRAESSREDGD